MKLKFLQSAEPGIGWLQYALRLDSNDSDAGVALGARQGARADAGTAAPNSHGL